MSWPSGSRAVIFRVWTSSSVVVICDNGKERKVENVGGAGSQRRGLPVKCKCAVMPQK